MRKCENVAKALRLIFTQLQIMDVFLGIFWKVGGLVDLIFFLYWTKTVSLRASHEVQSADKWVHLRVVRFHYVIRGPKLTFAFET